ncbi:hypothetical protein ACFQGX_32260 [Nonomuraea dietziae]|uniref:hypothetical protein n=1 Tax=Nonomuraea dietziae TaxID=65515 RepID=UPI00361B296C
MPLEKLNTTWCTASHPPHTSQAALFTLSPPRSPRALTEERSSPATARVPRVRQVAAASSSARAQNGSSHEICPAIVSLNSLPAPDSPPKEAPPPLPLPPKPRPKIRPSPL